MGNKPSRRKSTSDLPSDKKLRRKGSKADRVRDPAKHLSAPDPRTSYSGYSTGTAPQRSESFATRRTPEDISITIYRSYRDLGRNRAPHFKDGNEPVDFKLHRKSTARLEKPSTLPRSFGRSKSAAMPPRHAFTPNGEPPGFPALPEKEGILRGSGSARSSFRSLRHRPRTASVNSSALASSLVVASDLPSTAVVRRKLDAFEEHFGHELRSRFLALPEDLQLASVVIALDRGQCDRYVSLKDYMYNDEQSVPKNLLDPELQGRFVLTIPPALFHGIYHVYTNKQADRRLTLSLAGAVIQCVAAEAGIELTRIYEYQIALMYDDLAIRLLAQHAAECVLEHAENYHFVERNSSIASVVNTYPPNSDGIRKYISGVVGTKELKWDLFEVLKKPGLRKELHLQGSELRSDSGIDSPNFEKFPWKFCYSDQSEPFLYGYRGQVIEWDYAQSIYKLDIYEDRLFAKEIAMQDEDFHRLYMPYKRLVGYEMMQSYLNGLLDRPDAPKSRLSDLVREDCVDGGRGQEDIQPVYRPISGNAHALHLDKVILDNVDLTRADMRNVNLSETSAQNAKLLLADLDMAHFDKCNLQGADISYSNVQMRELSPDSLRAVRARHVLLSEAGDTLEREPKVNTVEQQHSPVPHSPDTVPHSPGTPQSPASPANPASPLGSKGRTPPALNSSFVSDHDGNMFTIPQAIEQEEARALAEEERRREAEAAETARQKAEHERRMLVTVEKVKANGDGPAEVKPAGKKKKSRKKRVDEVVEFMNYSVDSEAAHSVTDYNILDEKPTRAPTAGPSLHGKPPPKPAKSSNLTASRLTGSSAPNGTHRVGGTDSAPGGGASRNEADARRHNRSMDDVLEFSVSVQTESHPRYDLHNKSAELLVDRGGGGVAPLSLPPLPPEALHNMSLPSPTPAHNLSHDGGGAGSARQDGYATVSRAKAAQQRVTPRMVKSQSLHGHLRGAGRGVVTDPYKMGSLGSRRVLSQAELEYLRRSQIFTLLKGLHVGSLESLLPPLCAPFLGRQEETRDVLDLISAPGRVVTLTGCPGIGKSNLAVAVAGEMRPRDVCPIYIDCRTCRTVDGLRVRLLATFGLYFKAHEMDYFFRWLNSHEQCLLFVFDNLELSSALDMALSGFIDELLTRVRSLRVLSTSVRQFFRGASMHETYRVGDLRDHSEPLLSALLPDLHAAGKAALIEAADHVLYGVMLCARAFSITNVDAGRLYEDLSAPGECGLNVNRLQDAIFNFTTNELEQERLLKVALLVRKVLDHLPAEVVELLLTLDKVPGDFTMATAQALASVDGELTQEYLDELAMLGLVQRGPGEPGRERHALPFIVKLVLESCWPDSGQNTTRVVRHFVANLKQWNAQFHSVSCHAAVTALCAEYTNVVCVLRWLVEHEDMYEYCRELAELDYAMLLTECVPAELYEDMYESLTQQAEDAADLVSKTNALCCLAYRSLAEGKTDNGKAYAESAYDCMHAAQIAEKHKAFCMLCLGKAYWADEETREKGHSLVKSALDIYKQYYALKDPKSIFANEEYGRLLVEKECVQKARHIFNLSDFVMKDVIDKHPLLILSYDMRRSIWDKLFLFGRATEISQKAVDVARLYYGDHPITAEMLTRLCECIMKRGSLQEAIQVVVEALHIRLKVLGDHSDTAMSYKTLAYLMLRSGQYDEAIRFAQCALDMYDLIEAREKYRIDARSIMTQARHRQEKRASQYLSMESRDASKTNLTKGGGADWHNQSAFSAAFSTEV